MRRLKNNEDGTILVFVAIAIAVLLGMVAVSFDLGRMGATQTELQSFADNVALAAAGELDGRDNAITRAQNAAAAMIADSQTFGSGGRDLDGRAVSLGGDVTLTFMSAIDGDDVAPFADTVVNADGGYSPAEERAARYVRVQVRAHNVPLTFAAAFLGMTGSNEPDHAMGAEAVAGFTQFACDTTPLMFCVPNSGWTANANKGDLLLLRTGGNNAAWQPGNFGFLDPTTTAVPNPDGPCAGSKLSGHELWQCLVGAAGQVTSCYEINNGVDTEPGEKTGLAEAFNTRFDIYRSTMSDEVNSTVYQPAPNVIDGIVSVRSGAKKCDENDARPMPPNPGPASKVPPLAEQSLPLPVDDCMDPMLGTPNCSGGMVSAETRFGDGNWSQGRRSYMEWNYGDHDPATVEPDPFTGFNTRYEVYREEVRRATALASPRQESGLPQCNPNLAQDPAGNPDPERRTIIAAAVDCTANTFSGRASDIPVQEFVKIFMIQPVRVGSGGGSNFDLYGEVVESVGGAGAAPDGRFRDFVQLYR